MSEETSPPPIQSEESYTPNPNAARILSRLIQFGYAPSPLPDLPPEWFHALAAVLDVAAASRRVRWQTFVSSVKGFPYEMVEEVAAALEDALDRTEKDRVLYTSKDALYPPPSLRWCVGGLFAQPSLNLLVGDPGAKKTFLAIDLAVSVALGQPWLGHPVNPCPVLFVDEETGLYQLWGRLNAVLHAHGADESAPFDFISLGGYDLRDGQDSDALIHRALSRGSGLIVIDALANLMRTGESSQSSVQPVLFNLRRLAESCQAAVLVIHHTNRHGVFRGSSSISAAVDLMLSIRSAPTDSLIELHSLKARFSAPQPFCARAIFETHVPKSGEAATWGTPDGQERFHLELTEPPPAPFTAPPDHSPPRKGLKLSIMEFLARSPNATRDQIIASCSEYSAGSISTVMDQLLAGNVIKRTNPGSKGTKGTYALSD